MDFLLRVMVLSKALCKSKPVNHCSKQDWYDVSSFAFTFQIHWLIFFEMSLSIFKVASDDHDRLYWWNHRRENICHEEMSESHLAKRRNEDVTQGFGNLNPPSLVAAVEWIEADS